MSAAADRITRLVATSARPTVVARPLPGEISLMLGEPDFPTHPEIVEAAHAAATAGHTHYTDFAGDPELRSALAASLSAGARDPVDPASVVVTHGANAALAATILALVDHGDRVVIPDPTYSLYADLVQLAGGVIDRVPPRSDGWTDVDEICRRAAGARLVVICNPNNPTGEVLRGGAVDAVATATARAGGLLLADEAYRDIVYAGVPFTSTVSLDTFAEHIIHVQTFSKSFAMTGWRVGCLAAPVRVVEAIKAAHRTFNGSNNSVAQRAALTAVRLGERARAGHLEEYSARRDLMLDLLDAVPGLSAMRPDGAFYVFARLEPGLTSDEATALFRSHGVAVRSGTEYGPAGAGHVRLSFATDRDRISEGIARIAIALAERSTSPQGVHT